MKPDKKEPTEENTVRKCEDCGNRCSSPFYKCSWCSKIICSYCAVEDTCVGDMIVCEECFNEEYLYACAVCDNIYCRDDNEKEWYKGDVICGYCQQLPYTNIFEDRCPKLGHGKLFIGYCKDCGKLYFKDGRVKSDRRDPNQLRLDQFIKSSLPVRSGSI